MLKWKWQHYYDCETSILLLFTDVSKSLNIALHKHKITVVRGGGQHTQTIRMFFLCLGHQILLIFKKKLPRKKSLTYKCKNIKMTIDVIGKVWELPRFISSNGNFCWKLFWILPCHAHLSLARKVMTCLNF